MWVRCTFGLRLDKVDTPGAEPLDSPEAEPSDTPEAELQNTTEIGPMAHKRPSFVTDRGKPLRFTGDRALRHIKDQSSDTPQADLSDSLEAEP